MYSATLAYLNAVKAVGSTDPDKVMEQLKKTKINDMFVTDGVIRPDGLLEQDMLIVQVKTPAELKGDWDFYKILKTMKGEEAFGKLADWPALWSRSKLPSSGRVAGEPAKQDTSIPTQPAINRGVQPKREFLRNKR